VNVLRLVRRDGLRGKNRTLGERALIWQASSDANPGFMGISADPHRHVNHGRFFVTEHDAFDVNSTGAGLLQIVSTIGTVTQAHRQGPGN
jgi:hypothetical protein